jgi:hypothetical protein
VAHEEGLWNLKAVLYRHLLLFIRWWSDQIVFDADFSSSSLWVAGVWVCD